MQISGCNDKSTFTGLVSSDPAIDCFGQAGYTGLPQFENRDELLRELCHFFVIDKARSALEQFKEGLTVYH